MLVWLRKLVSTGDFCPNVPVIIANSATMGYSNGKLTAQPRAASISPQKISAYGLQPLHISQSRIGLLFVPHSYAESSKRPAPLVVMMHGAGGNAKGGIAYMIDYAEEVCC